MIHKWLLIVLLLLLYMCNSDPNSKNRNENTMVEFRIDSLNTIKDSNFQKRSDFINHSLSDQKQSKVWINFRCLSKDKINSDIEYLIINIRDFEFINTGYFPNLKGLDISGQSFSAFPKDLGKLKKLEILIGRRNKFKDIPTDICFLKELTELYLESNDLIKIPDCISNLRKVKILLINDNLIKLLPEEIGELENLETFEIVNNKLEKLPAGFYKLSNLKHCNLQGNNIQDLSNQIKNFKKLKYLDLSSNKLSSIPEGIFELDSLKVLRLKNNFLSNEEITKIKKAMPKTDVR
jgi:Leucine-rich repeat (LRR) protein